MFLFALALALAPLSAASDVDASGKLYVGILFQEDVTDGVATDLPAYRDFVQSLPMGTEVMIGYARVGTNEIRQELTTDLGAAADALRAPGGLPSSAPGSPYQSVKEFAKLFPEGPGKKVLIFVSDGVDRYGPLESSPRNNPILNSAIRVASKRGIQVHTIFAPASLTAGSRSLAFTGQDSLSYLSDKTGGKTHFNGTSYVTARAHLGRISELISK